MNSESTIMRYQLFATKSFCRRAILIFSITLLGFTSSTYAQLDKAAQAAWSYDYAKAEKYLSKRKFNSNGDAVLQLAEVLFRQQKYAQALYYYRKADQMGMLRTTALQRNYVHAANRMNEKSPYYLQTDYFSSAIQMRAVIDTFGGNSSNEDFSAFYWNRTLFLTTSRTNLRNMRQFNYVYTGMPYLDVIPYNEDGNQVRIPGCLPKDMNTKLHDGPVFIADDTSMLLLTQNYPEPNKEGVNHLNIKYYLRTRGKWSGPEMFPFCNPAFTVQHPFFDARKQVMYFSSNMPGGFGGFDLYQSSWDGSKWGQPVNLGESVNSVFDEVFPAVNTSGEMTYATNHLETTGGLDMVLLRDGKRYLLPAPFNTVYDDFGLMFKSSNEGYFTSNRYAEAYDDNIYHFVAEMKPTQSLFVRVFDRMTGQRLDSVYVRFGLQKGNANTKILARATQDQLVISDTANASMDLYFRANKFGYMESAVFGHDYQTSKGNLYCNIYLSPINIVAYDNHYRAATNKIKSRFPSVLLNDTLGMQLVQPDEITMRQLDYPLAGAVRLDPAGAVNLEAHVMPGTYSFKYEIASLKYPEVKDTATVYVTVENDPYYVVPGPLVQTVNDTGYISTAGGFVLNCLRNDLFDAQIPDPSTTHFCSITGDRTYLSLKKSGRVEALPGIPAGKHQLYYTLCANQYAKGRDSAIVTVYVKEQNARELVSDQQVVVYFHNDQPKAQQLTSKGFTYEQSYKGYVTLFPVYYNYSVDSRSDLELFFNDQLMDGYRKLNQQLIAIQDAVGKGMSVEVELNAFCSPLAAVSYNTQLAKRRIESIQRYLLGWNNGELRDAFVSGKLKLIGNPFGEDKAPLNVSYDLNEKDKSVYGLKASLERRVSISVRTYK